jgi:hypothetical protein
MAEDAPWADPVVVPDDIRELQADIDAYHREIRLAHRRRWLRQLTASTAWQRWSFPAGMLAGAVVLALAVTLLLVIDSHRLAGYDTREAPLATTTAAAGSVGGLLPAVTLTTTAGDRVPAESLRPALVALLPPHCDCAPLLSAMARQAASLQLRLVVIGPSLPDAEIAALPGQLSATNVSPLYDPAGTLASTYAAHGVTALVLGRDGTVTYVARDVTDVSRLGLPLQTALLLPPSVR